MKIAIVCDFLIDRGGAERQTLILAKSLKCDIITTQYIPKRTYEDFSKLNIIQYPLKTYPTPILMHNEAAKKFRSIDLSDYDVVISMGDLARHISLNKTLSARHLHITISPPRMFSDLKLSIEKNLGFLKRQIFRNWAYFAAKRDKEAMSKIKDVIVQSKEARKRIKDYYKREVNSDILYPPTEIRKFKSGKSYVYFLSVQRIMPAKNVDTQIRAFNKLPAEKLIIAGSMLDSKIPYFNELRKAANKNIEFRINITDKELIELYSHAKCVIQTSTREDFGLVPVEAMASGKPCIAVNEGGFKETITQKTGILIEKPYEENLMKAVKNFDTQKFKRTDLIKRSKYFSDDIFIKKIKDIVFRDV